MSFRDPIFFLGILPLLIVAFLVFFRQKNNRATLQISSVAVLKSVRTSLRSKFIHLPVIMKLVALCLVLVALARPQQMDQRVQKNVDGIDIVIALDISDSMLIEDMKPENRLESAKDTIRRFIQKRTSDRIGVVIFAGEAFTLVPPTLDYQLVLNRVAEITTAHEARIKDGTALGVALGSAAGRLKDSQAKSRVMIFLTDGENNSGTIDPETGLEIAKGYGIKVYSIGIGKSGPTRIPVYSRDIFGNKVKSYQPFESTVNEELLQQMAKETGGKYWKAANGDALESVFSAIDRLEKTKIEVNKFTRYKELFPPWLMMALALYFVGSLLGMTILKRLP